MKVGWLFLGLLYLFIGIVYTYREYLFIRKQRDLLIISFARLLYGCTFGFIPAMLCLIYVISDSKIKLGTLVAVDYSADGLLALWILLILSFIGYCMLCIGYRKTRRIVFRYSQRSHIINQKEMSENQIILLGIICLILGVVSLLLWTMNEGSVFNFIVKANWYRADYTNSQNNAYAMFKQPAKLVQISAYIFFFYLIKNNCKHKVLFWFGYSLSLFASILYLLCTDGRLAIALFFGIQVLGFVLYRSDEIKITRKQMFIIVVLAMLALLMIAKMDDITYFIRHGFFKGSNDGKKNSFFLSILNEFGYVYESSQVSIKNNIFSNGKWMIIDDAVRGLFSCLPSRFTPDGFERIWRWNTFLCTGSEVAGTIPCDMISEAIYDLGILGPAIIPFFWGKMMRICESAYCKKKSNPFYRACYMCLVMAFFRIINYCELYDFARGLFAFFVMWIISIFVRRMRI